jgi:uncharacterized protein involved in exopolysaccharide biosynthesis
MRSIFFRILSISLCLTLPANFQLFAQSEGNVQIYLDPKQPIEAGVEDLLSRMTLKEKVRQLNLPYPDQIESKRQVGYMAPFL